MAQSCEDSVYLTKLAEQAEQLLESHRLPQHALHYLPRLSCPLYLSAFCTHTYICRWLNLVKTLSTSLSLLSNLSNVKVCNHLLCVTYCYIWSWFLATVPMKDFRGT